VTPLPPSPSAAPPSLPKPASPAPSATLTLTIATPDEGKTFRVKVGSMVLFDLKADSGMQPWMIQPPDPAILAPAGSPPAAQGETKQLYRAAAPGMAMVTATGRPSCNPGQACPQFIRSWRVTVVVEP